MGLVLFAGVIAAVIFWRLFQSASPQTILLPTVVRKELFGVFTLQSVVLALGFGGAYWALMEGAPEPFSAPIGGFLAMSGRGKSFEYTSEYLGAIVFAGSMVLLYTLGGKLAARGVSHAAAKAGWYSLIPLPLVLGQSLMVKSYWALLTPALFSVILGIVTQILLLKVPRERAEEAADKIFVSLVLAVASWFGAALCASRLHLPFPLGWVYLALFAVAFIVAFRKGNFNLMLMASQLGLPLFFTAFLPVTLVLSSGKVYNPGWNALPKILVTLLVLGGYANLIYVWRKHRNDTAAALIATLPLAALLTVFILPPEVWPNVYADDYHHGEVLLPWYLWHDAGYAPYCGYYPSRGLINYLPGFFTWLFKGMDFSLLPLVSRWAVLPVMTAALWVFRRRNGLLLAAFGLTVVAEAGHDLGTGMLTGLTAGVTLLAFLTAPAWEKRPVAWLWSYCVLGVLGTIYSLTDALPVLVALFPYGVWQVVNAWKADSKRAVKHLIGIVIFVLAVLAIGWRMWRPMLEILLLQGGCYTLAHCVPLMLKRVPDPVTQGYFWQLVRFAFFVPGLAAVAVMMLPRGKGKSLGHFWTCAAAALLTLVLVQRAGGRIDVSNFSRIYVTSGVMVALVLPFLVLPVMRRATRKWALVAWLFAIGLLGTQCTLWADLPKRLVPALLEPEGTINAAQAGFPEMGNHAVLAPEHFQNHREIAAVLRELLRPGETVWDLTNCSNTYLWHHLRPAVPYAAYFYVADPRMAEKLAKDLAQNLPPLALLGARNVEFHEGKLPLRTYAFYELLLQNYRVFEDTTGKIWAIRKGEEKRLENAAKVKAKSLDSIDLWCKALCDEKIDGYPMSWGMSMDKMKLGEGRQLDVSRALVKNAHRLSGNHFTSDATVSVTFPGDVQGDFLYVEFDRPLFSLSMRAFWIDDFEGKGTSELKFIGKEQKFLIPLSASPNWYLSKSHHNLTVEFSPLTDRGEFKLLRAELWTR